MSLLNIGYTDPILMVEVSPSSVTISPNDQFTVTCIARAEVDGQDVHFLMLMSWVRITKSPSGLMRESQLTVNDILTTTENDTVNMIIYCCKAKIPYYPSVTRCLDVTVTFEGM